MRRVLGVLALLLLVMLPAGCYDYSEPDEKAWVMAMGLDRGRQNVLTVTAVIAVPKNIAGSGGGQPAAGGGGKNFFTVSLEAPTLLSSLELLNAVVDRRADLSHIKWFVFSRELAEQGIGEYLAPISRFYQFRRTSLMLVCQGRAEDFLARGLPVLEDNAGKYYELMHRGWRYTEFIPFDTFHQFYYKSSAPGVVPVAMLASLERKEPVYPDNAPKPKGKYEAGRIPRQGGSSIEVMGAAVFRQERMVGTLNADETGLVKLINGTLRRTLLDVRDPKHPDKFVIMEVKPRQRPSVKVQIAGGHPSIEVDIKMEGGIISIQSGEEYEKPGNIPFLEDAVEKELLEDFHAAVAKSQELGADFFGFGLYAKKLFRTWPEWEAYNWDEKYPMASVTLHVDFKVRRIGLIHETLPQK